MAIEAYEVLVSPYKPNGQRCTVLRPGICDPLLDATVNALQPIRYSSAVIPADLVATDTGAGTIAANNDGADVQINVGTISVLGPTTALGAIIPGGWWAMTRSDTDFISTTGPVSRGQCFVVFGAAFAVKTVAQRGGTGADPADPLKRSVWLNNSQDSRGYTYEIVRAILEFTSVQYQFGAEGRFYNGGILRHTPQFGSVQGDQTYRNGPGDAAYAPFPTCILIADNQDAMALNVQLVTDRPYNIQSDGTTVAGSAVATAGSINALNNGQVYIVVECVLVGSLVCCPPDKLCALMPDEQVGAFTP